MKRILIPLVIFFVLLACQSDQITQPPITPPGTLLSQLATITLVGENTWDIVCVTVGQVIEISPNLRGLVYYSTEPAHMIEYKILTDGDRFEFNNYYFRNGVVLSSCPSQWQGDLFNSYEYRGGCASSEKIGGMQPPPGYTVVEFPVAPYTIKILGLFPPV